MKNITAKEHFGYAVTIRRLFEGCTNEFGEPCFTNKETGEIRCFGGKLNPRPSYQREFVYSEQDQKKVFETLHRAFPLGTMYWCDTGDGSYELIDGQQRTISILNILTDGVSISMYGEDKFFSDLPESEQEQILDQELLVYVCSVMQISKVSMTEISTERLEVILEYIARTKTQNRFSLIMKKYFIGRITFSEQNTKKNCRKSNGVCSTTVITKSRVRRVKLEQKSMH